MKTAPTSRTAARLAVLAALSAFALGPAAAITLKIASIAPEATPWGAMANRMAADFGRITGGEVELKVFHGGIAGDESDQLRKLKIGQIQGAVFTTLGLNMISPEPLTLSAPLLIRTEDELDYILAEDRDYLQKRIEAKGEIVLAWSKAGWIHFFSRKPLAGPEDLKRMKLATTPSDLELAQAFKTIGYSLVPVPISETLVALSSGMIDALYTTPLIAGATQVFGVAKYMTDWSLGPGIGAIVLSAQAWSRISPASRAKILEYCKGLESGLARDIVQLEADALKVMKDHGLVVTPTSPAVFEAWKEALMAGLPATIGSSFDKETYELVSRQLEEYRASKQKK